MTLTATIPNEATALADHDASLLAIRTLVAQSDKHNTGYRTSLYSALSDIFDLTDALVGDDAIKSFVQNHGGEWGKVARNNPFQPVVALAFDGSPAASAISKYALVLKHAQRHKPAHQTIPEWIESSGGIEKLSTLARSEETPNDKLYDETEEERIERAFHQLQAKQLGEVQTGRGYTAATPSLGEYGRALVRHVGGKLEVVSLLPAAREEVRDDLFKLVPREPRCARRKLVDKPLYDLFRLCDIASRFFVNAKSDKDEAEGVSDKKRSKKRASGDVRYDPQTGLRFIFSDGVWRAETISTAPTFPIVRYEVTEPLPELDRSKHYFLSSRQAKNLADTFTDIKEWSVRLRNHAQNGSYDAAELGEIVFDELNANAAWRVAMPVRSAVLTFNLRRQDLQTLIGWPKEYRSLANGDPDAAGFPKLLALSIDKNELFLQFPDYLTLTAGARNGMRQKQQLLYEAQQKTFGTLSSTVSLDLADRFLARVDLDLIGQLSSDYGFSFEAQLCDFNEDVAAVLLSVERISLIVPLRVALTGDRAGIAEMMKG